MRRRRGRRPAEIAFSFDSFLDVVANVVGIIIRFILVIWVGARSYHALKNQAVEEEPAAAVAAAVAVADVSHLPGAGTGPAATVEEDESPPADRPDPLEGELAEARDQLAGMEAALVARLRELEEARGQRDHVARQREEVAARKEQVRARAGAQAAGVQAARREGQRREETLAEVRERCRKLAEEVTALEAAPRTTRTHRYHTPVSRPVDAEELMFEIKGGRVTFIDVAALLEEVKRGLRDKAETLKRSWEAKDVAGPVGPFEMRYTVERLKDGIGGIPDPEASFSYGVSAWQVEPVAEVRGEPLERALRPGSEFRQIVDGLDPKYAAVTFWVYPDSFPVYRQLRDYLYRRDLVVAGRPLPEGVPIASSRHGTHSRGQ